MGSRVIWTGSFQISFSPVEPNWQVAEQIATRCLRAYRNSVYLKQQLGCEPSFAVAAGDPSRGYRVFHRVSPHPGGEAPYDRPSAATQQSELQRSVKLQPQVYAQVPGQV